RLGADVSGTSTLLVARTDAQAAKLITSDHDPYDEPFIESSRTAEGFYKIKGGDAYAIARGLAYAEYADLVWCETSKPDLGQAREFAEEIHATYPGKLLAYNCSPSFNWRLHLEEQTIATFQEKLGEMGYALQFVTLSGWHSLNTAIFELAKAYREFGMAAYSKLQQREFDLHDRYGYRAIKHQAFVGAGYFDQIQLTVTGGEASTTALDGSTEEEQFH
ncbi:MAG: isocitrate lyase, partial [Myxococcota bacterium]